MKPKKITQPEKMTVSELRDWIAWAENEIEEYATFILTLKEELRRRKK